MLLRVAGVQHSVEVMARHVLTVNVGDKRLDLVLNPLFSSNIVADVTVRGATTAAYVNSRVAQDNPTNNTCDPGHALSKAVADKKRAYGEACQQDGFELKVLAVEQMGKMHRDCHALLKQCFSGEDQAWAGDPRRNWSTPTRKTFLYQVLSVCLQNQLGKRQAQLSQFNHCPLGWLDQLYADHMFGLDMWERGDLDAST